MLKTTKSVTVTGNAMIDGQQVVYLSANITTETAGNSSINQSIQNQELYRTNSKECRTDIAAFQEVVWGIEDEMMAEQELLDE